MHRPSNAAGRAPRAARAIALRVTERSLAMMLDIRQRTGWLFTGVVLAQLVLVSAQVTTRTGVPMLEVGVFGTVAEVQRLASGVMQGADDSWHQYIALQEVRRENA